jgi:hypothetical protein
MEQILLGFAGAGLPFHPRRKASAFCGPGGFTFVIEVVYFHRPFVRGDVGVFGARRSLVANIAGGVVDGLLSF